MLHAWRMQGTGDYAEYAPIQDAGTGLLPGGYTNNPKVSASALAASQQVNAANQKQQLASDVTQVLLTSESRYICGWTGAISVFGVFLKLLLSCRFRAHASPSAYSSHYCDSASH